jgi:hypothetical protein
MPPGGNKGSGLGAGVTVINPSFRVGSKGSVLATGLTRLDPSSGPEAATLATAQSAGDATFAPRSLGRPSLTSSSFFFLLRRLVCPHKPADLVHGRHQRATTVAQPIDELAPLSGLY